MARMAAFLALAIGLLAALPAAARPYLMLDADDRGFLALDLGGMDRSQAGRVKATLIQAPLAGVEVDGRLAPLIERRVEVDCAGARWRVEATAYVDGEERVMGREDGQAWKAVGADDVAGAVQAAACRRQYRQQAVSRYLNIGEILANFQAAHAKAAPEPPTKKELEDRAFKNGH